MSRNQSSQKKLHRVNLSEYADVFAEDLGCMKGKVHLETDPNVASTVMPPRRVPVAIKEKLKNELDPN